MDQQPHTLRSYLDAIGMALQAEVPSATYRVSPDMQDAFSDGAVRLDCMLGTRRLEILANIYEDHDIDVFDAKAIYAIAGSISRVLKGDVAEPTSTVAKLSTLVHLLHDADVADETNR